jgi:hypothetical protein
MSLLAWACDSARQGDRRAKGLRVEIISTNLSREREQINYWRVRAPVVEVKTALEQTTNRLHWSAKVAPREMRATHGERKLRQFWQAYPRSSRSPLWQRNPRPIASHSPLLLGTGLRKQGRPGQRYPQQ